MTDVTNFVEGKMERFLDYQKECNKLFALTEKRDIRDQIKVLVDKMEDKDLVPLKTSLMKSLLDKIIVVLVYFYTLNKDLRKRNLFQKDLFVESILVIHSEPFVQVLPLNQTIR